MKEIIDKLSQQMEQHCKNVYLYVYLVYSDPFVNRTLAPLKGASPVGNYIFKVNNRNTRIRCEICSKLTIKTPERRY